MTENNQVTTINYYFYHYKGVLRNVNPETNKLVAHREINKRVPSIKEGEN